MNRSSISNHQEVDQQQEQLDQPGSDAATGCLLRIYWMLIGNVFLGMMAYQIIQAEGKLSRVDLLYWLAAVSLIFVRYLDIYHLRGRTTEGQPATPGDWRRYALGVLGVSVALWVVVHGVGFLV